jgi:hypothetical protein
MKNILTLLMVFILLECSAQKLPNPNKPETLTLESEFIYTPYDQVMTVWIPLDKNWPRFVPPHLKHVLNNTLIFQQVNEPVLSGIPKTILDGISLNTCTVIPSVFDKKTHRYLNNPLHKDSLNALIDKFTYGMGRRTDNSDQKLRDSFAYFISRTMQVHIRVRDSMGTMIYTPERITLILEDSQAPSNNFCITDLNQAIFHKPYQDNKSIYDLLKSMNYEYYPVNYQFRKGNKPMEFRISSYEISLAVKYSIMSGGTEIFKQNIKKPYHMSIIGLLPKHQKKSEQQWQKARDKYQMK